MSCEAYLERISAQLDGALTVQEEEQLANHLRSCPECRAVAEELRNAHGVLTGLEPVQPPEDLCRQVMERVEADKRGRRAAIRRRMVRQLAGLAACLTLCVGLYQLAQGGMEKRVDGAAEPYTAVQFEAEDRAAAAGPVCTAAPGTAYATAGSGATPNSKAAVTAKSAQNGAAEQADAAAPAHYFFCNDQYIRVTQADGLEAPSARILGSMSSLTEFIALFPEDDLSGLAERYDEDYFRTGRLLAVVLTEPSSSNRHELASQGLLYDSVTVLRRVPEAGDCDMAAWLILAEVDTMFEEGRQMTVEVKTQS